MDLMKKLLLFLAIFCVIGSAAAVSAADGYDDVYAQDGQYDALTESQYNETEEGGYAGSQYNMTEEGGWAGSQYNMTEEGGWAGSQYNETLENAAGAPVNATASAAAGNATSNASAHAMLATGNPILALLAVGAVLGGAAVISRRK